MSTIKDQTPASGKRLRIAPESLGGAVKLTKVLYISNQPGPTMTGADRRLSSLIDRAQDAGWTVYMAAPKSSRLHAKYANSNVACIAVDLSPTPSAISSIRRSIKAIKPDLVHANSIYPLAFLRMAGCMSHTPVTAANVNVDPSSSHPLAVKRLKSLVTLARNIISRREATRIDRIFTLAPTLKAKLQGLGIKGRIVVTSTGVDSAKLDHDALEPFDMPEGYPIIVTTVGQLEKFKGVEYLISALADVKKEFGDARLLIAGSGTLEKSLRQQSAALGLQDDVVFLGYLSNVAKVVSRSDIYVLPSLSEGLNSSLLEAMSLAVASISTDAGGPKDIIKNGITGLLVPPASVESLAEAITILARDQILARNMGRKARQTILEEYPVNCYLDCVFAEYERLLGPSDSAIYPIS